jgi:hypothetical protein
MSNFFAHRKKGGVNPAKRVRDHFRNSENQDRALKKEIIEYAKIDNVKINNIKLEEAIRSTYQIRNHFNRVNVILNKLGKKLPSFKKNTPKGNIIAPIPARGNYEFKNIGYNPNLLNETNIVRKNIKPTKGSAFKKFEGSFLNRIKNINK